MDNTTKEIVEFHEEVIRQAKYLNKSIADNPHVLNETKLFVENLCNWSINNSNLNCQFLLDFHKGVKSEAPKKLSY